MTLRDVCKHQLFAMNYIETLNAREAAKRTGYSELSASRLMNHPTVQMHIEQLQHELKLAWVGRVIEITAGLKSISTANMANYVIEDADGKTRLKRPERLSKDASTAISRIVTNEDGHVIGIEFKEKLPAIEGFLNRLGIDGINIQDDDLYDLKTKLNTEIKAVRRIKSELAKQKLELAQLKRKYITELGSNK